MKDESEQIAAQLDYWHDLDAEYWRQRKEFEYSRYLERKLSSQRINTGRTSGSVYDGKPQIKARLRT